MKADNTVLHLKVGDRVSPGLARAAAMNVAKPVRSYLGICSGATGELFSGNGLIN